MAFTQIQSLSNDPKILNNYLMFTESCIVRLKFAFRNKRFKFVSRDVINIVKLSIEVYSLVYKNILLIYVQQKCKEY